MLCPYCLKEFHFQPYGAVVLRDQKPMGGTFVDQIGSAEQIFTGGFCPGCQGKIVIHGVKTFKNAKGEGKPPEEIREELVGMIYPRKHTRKPVPPEVPPQFGSDYDEACLVLEDSPKASAALSRRLLQRIFHEHYSIRERDLSTEIKNFLATHKPPSYLSEALDAVRNIGNFAAHPLKDTSTGMILDVAPGEADWLIELLDTLFDYTFVQPERQRKKVATLNAKLAAAGKSMMSVSPPTARS